MLTHDDPVQWPLAEQALEAASTIAVTNVALCELAWVLARSGSRSRTEIAASMHQLLEVENVVADGGAVEAGLAFMAAGGDFADGVIAYEGLRLGGEVLLTFGEQARSIANTLSIAAVAP